MEIILYVFGVFHVRRLVGNDGLVDTGREAVDQVDVGGKFAVFLLGDTTRDEDAEMTDVFMNSVDDRLIVHEDVFI